MPVEQDLILTYLLTHLDLPLTISYFFILPTYLGLPLIANSVVLNFATHVYLPELTLDCQSKQSSIHLVNSINVISLIFFKSIFLVFIFSLSLPPRMLSLTLLSAFHLFIVFSLPDLVGFPFFLAFSLSSFLYFF